MRFRLTRLVIAAVLCAPFAIAAQEAATAAPAEAADAAPSPAPREQAAPAPAPAADAPAPASQSKGAIAIAAPEAGKGQIVFFREKKFAGAAVNYIVREGETELGKLSSGSYFVVAVEPGAHAYTVHSEAKDVLNLEVEAGETYYVIGGITMGFLAGRPNLSPSDQAAFDAMSGKLKPSKPLKN
ncbi:MULTISPECIES: DUF2846 domain-containing protein [unclassified Pseudoxanthomonas]|uniref:DUF2846 domain-containing protein n=1 Tax=unclassified Pseudoxanthomonas TaxID=2645906 RepID=UPI00161D1D7C|nr:MULTISPECIES: DUF2846 domain-containing protein [unclassified Pseudoxanthomonas]MBB3277979.1 pyruvate/2-oxoglutarate dehydrogenase complex dihydrolipoamide acyltransferase (E2) component [Pseudoxanthomonas sp. OG2]MBD9375793.1 hypothetical protein [Pseudoxanthomonas sp. PXM04]MBV7474649.1 DUF2846 domain-containing protein [Pseudoxanthomonas sp. PXM05]